MRKRLKCTHFAIHVVHRTFENKSIFDEILIWF